MVAAVAGAFTGGISAYAKATAGAGLSATVGAATITKSSEMVTAATVSLINDNFSDNSPNYKAAAAAAIASQISVGKALSDTVKSLVKLKTDNEAIVGKIKAEATTTVDMIIEEAANAAKDSGAKLLTTTNTKTINEELKQTND